MGEVIEVLDPCGPSHLGYSGEHQEHFRHWAGSSSHLVFDIDDTIWALNIEDGLLEQVADADSDYADVDGFDGFRFVYGFHADVLPGGSRIVYSSCEYMMKDVFSDQTSDIFSEGYEIVAVNLDGTGHQRLTKTPHFDNYPAISPDGTQIAFVSYRGTATLGVDIYHYNHSGYAFAGTGIATMPTNISAADRTAIRWIGFQNRVSPYPPVWSPDGRYLAYMNNEGEVVPYEEVIYIVPVDDPGLTRIGAATALPTWSPNSQELAYATVEDDNAVVYLVRTDGTHKRPIWHSTHERPIWYSVEDSDSVVVSEVLWSPDGSQLLLVSDHTYLIGTDGSDPRRLESMPTDYDGVRPAAWSADGSRIAIYNPDHGIITIGRDGTDLRVLMEIDSNGQPRSPLYLA